MSNSDFTEYNFYFDLVLSIKLNLVRLILKQEKKNYLVMQ